MPKTETAGEFAHALDHLTNTYVQDVPNAWPVSPPGGGPSDCRDGDCTPEYVNLPDESCAAVSRNDHHPRT